MCGVGFNDLMILRVVVNMLKLKYCPRVVRLLALAGTMAFPPFIPKNPLEFPAFSSLHFLNNYSNSIYIGM